jgi:hypothetical protein
MSMYDNQGLPVRQRIRDAHEAAIETFAEPGTWLDSDSRLAILAEARHAHTCRLCAERKEALSPYAVKGTHEARTELPKDLVEIVHRISTDSGRLTLSWYEGIVDAGISPEMYVEVVGLVATLIIVDSFGAALGTELAEPPAAKSGEPSRERNSGVIDAGAWVPLLDVEQEETDLEIPTAPNIFRAMGLVPGAIAHFFNVMRTQYSLTEFDISLGRSQIELLASRVSSLNQCFY